MGQRAMGKMSCYFSSSIGKKQIMAVTGLLLCGFLLGHLAGNLLILYSPEAFNRYGHALITNPLIYVAEAGLALLFLSHIGLAIRLTIENKVARQNSYVVKIPTGRGATLASSTMPITGVIILVFLVFHLINFKFGNYYSVTYEGVVMRDLYRLVMEEFSRPIIVGFYLFSMLAMGLHLSHGFSSAFQSLGINHPKYNCKIKLVGYLFAAAMTIGFSLIPVYCFLQGGMNS